MEKRFREDICEAYVPLSSTKFAADDFISATVSFIVWEKGKKRWRPFYHLVKLMIDEGCSLRVWNKNYFRSFCFISTLTDSLGDLQQKYLFCSYYVRVRLLCHNIIYCKFISTNMIIIYIINFFLLTSIITTTIINK